jgi:asparagine synthase (glutamine-hydrolysing)
LVSTYLDDGPRDALMHRLMYLDMKTWLVDDILMKVDRMSMAVSLEARAPFLDHKLVEFVATLPATLKISRFQTKWLLKKALAPLLPALILRRRKHAFRVPIGEWFRGKLRAYMSEQLLAPNTAVGRYLDRAQVQRLVQEHLDGKANHEHSIWTLLCFELWHRIFIDGEPLA